MEKLVLTGLFPEEITERLSIPQSFRGKQIFKWISSHATDFSQMTNLSKEFREELEQKAVIRSSKVNLVLKDPDGTVKLQIKLFDGLHRNCSSDRQKRTENRMCFLSGRLCNEVRILSDRNSGTCKKPYCRRNHRRVYVS